MLECTLVALGVFDTPLRCRTELSITFLVINKKVGGNGLAIAPNKNNTLTNFQTGES
jgi:hypothetical protein